ncbi:hypothetical protein NP493_158g00003 [Ridgeia piscesae]|uniref:Uncharacterized protein n=1 Tax=Ridgeia piscesae TaxID=27915 RepID=A0AAD9P3S9_RIDPI|nr:hypothetical protein NP493_158g00003 [Ridgeia piscesae]
MTTIAFGGGPTVDQRRDFANLQDGSHVPGYGGYCPHLKYRVGKTYGQDTHELAQKYDAYKPMDALTPRPKIVLRNGLPESTGDNRYTSDMVPGYTGRQYMVPRYTSRQYMVLRCTGRQYLVPRYTSRQHMVLRYTSRQYMVLQYTGRQYMVPQYTNTHTHTHTHQPILLADRRSQLEPPMPGYNGYIPRIYTTEMGLGCRYNNMTRNGLHMFRAEQDAHFETMRQPVSVKAPPTPVKGPTATYSQRVYLPDGMIPKYTGYVPRRRYHFGNTYGDTTRSLDVCAHPLENYGAFMKGRVTVANSIL